MIWYLYEGLCIYKVTNNFIPFRLYSSVGRALDSKSKGHRFKSGYGHFLTVFTSKMAIFLLLCAAFPQPPTYLRTHILTYSYLPRPTKPFGTFLHSYVHQNTPATYCGWGGRGTWASTDCGFLVGLVCFYASLHPCVETYYSNKFDHTKKGWRQGGSGHIPCER